MKRNTMMTSDRGEALETRDRMRGAGASMTQAAARLQSGANAAPLLILLTIVYLTGCATHQMVQQEAHQIIEKEAKVEWEYPKPPPDWAVGKRKLGPHEFKGISKLDADLQRAHRNAYEDAINQVATELGTEFAGRMLQAYDSQSVSELEKRTGYQYTVRGAHPVQFYIERFFDKRYRIHLLVECNVEKLRPEIKKDKLPPKDDSAQSHALWQAMDSLMTRSEYVEDEFLRQKPRVYISPINSEVDNLLRDAIGKTEVLTLVATAKGAEALLKGEYKTAGDQVELHLELKRTNDDVLPWICTAKGLPHRSKWRALWPFKHQKWWQTGVLGIAWGASSYWHNKEYNEYQELRGVTRDELDAAYNETRLPYVLRIASGIAFGGLLMSKTVSTWDDARTYQKQRRQSELEAYQLSRLEFMPNGIRLSRRF